MAGRFNSFKTRYGGYKRRYNNARTIYRTRFVNSGFYRRYGGRLQKANESIGLYNPGFEYLAGALIGVTDIDNKIPAPVKVALAAAPLRGGVGGKVNRFMRGMLLGDVVTHVTGFSIPVLNKVGLDNSGKTSNMGW